MANPSRFRRAMEAIDACNAQDPEGRESEHARAVVAWIDVLAPDASPALRLAGRAQHMGRWRIPRDRYPGGRAGYLRWRRDLQAFHAEQAGRLLADCGYPAEFVQRVGAIMRKERLREDSETQTLEDALCLVFLQSELESFRRRHGEAKVRRIVRRSWDKMSTQGRRAALQLALPESLRDLLPDSPDDLPSGARADG